MPPRTPDTQRSMEGLTIGTPIPVAISIPTSAPAAAVAAPQEPDAFGSGHRVIEDIDEDDLQGHPAKRQKREASVPNPQPDPQPRPQPELELGLRPEQGQEQNDDGQPSNEDEAVLALAADGLADPVDNFSAAE